MENCIFCKIAMGEIPVDFLYEDDAFVVFRDAHPQAPVHVLLIPRTHHATLMDVNDADMLGRALLVTQEVAKRLAINEEGFRLVLNTRDNGGQTVYHLHFHILGGRFMQWPPG